MMYKLHYNAANVSNSGILRSNICQNFSYASAVAIWKYEWYDFILARYFHEFFCKILTHLDKESETKIKIGRAKFKIMIIFKLKWCEKLIGSLLLQVKKYVNQLFKCIIFCLFRIRLTLAIWIMLYANFKKKYVCT